MPVGAALRGLGRAFKKFNSKSKTSPTISSVKPSVHTTKKAQKTARMKEQFDKQMSRTRSDRRMGKADGGPIPRGGHKFREEQIAKAKAAAKARKEKTTRKPKNPFAPTPKDIKNYRDESRARIREKGRDKKADGGPITPRDINKNGKTDGFERARAKGMAKGMGRQFRDSKASGGKATYKTKDGRTVKKGLYYYMNRAKKRGTSKPGKGSVTDKALRDSAKTAKKD